MKIKKQSTISNRGKRRLQIAANIIRQQGIKFDGENFYDMVLKNIDKLHDAKKDELKEMVDWVEGYEVTDSEINGHQLAPARFKIKKQKTAGKKRATRSAPPSAKTIKGVKEWIIWIQINWMLNWLLHALGLDDEAILHHFYSTVAWKRGDGGWRLS